MKLLRRTTIVTVVSALFGALLPTGPAGAEGEVVRVDGISPDVFPQDIVKRATIDGLFVEGDGDVEVAQPVVTVSGTGVTADYSTHDANRIIVDLEVLAEAPPGLRDLHVEQAEFSDTCTECLRIGPSLTSVDPAEAPNDGTSDVALDIRGDGFFDGAEVTLEREGIGFTDDGDFTDGESFEIEADSETVTGRKQIDATLHAETLAGHAPGDWDVVVTNPDGGQDRLTGGFTITGGVPEIEAIVPDELGIGGEEPDELVIEGSNLSRGSVVAFDPDDVVQAGPVEWTSLDEMVVPVDFEELTPTTFDVNFQDAVGETAQCESCFAVVEPALVTSLEPDELDRGAEAVLRATGERLPETLSRTDLAFSDGAVTVEHVGWIDTETVDLTVRASADAPLEGLDLEVSDPTNGGTSTCESCLTVTEAPPTTTTTTPTSTTTTMPATTTTTTTTAPEPETEVKEVVVEPAPPRGNVTPSGDGYWIPSPVGTVEAFGDAAPVPGISGLLGVAFNPEREIVDVASDQTGEGVWLLERSGGVHALGSADYHGSIPERRAQGFPIGTADAASIASTPSGNGYAILDEAGGIHTFGDARYHGSIPQRRAEGLPIGVAETVSIAMTPTGEGYMVLEDNGGIHTFGDARYHGSIPALRLAGVPVGDAELVSVALAPGGDGYWILDEHGGVHTFGEARYHGSIPALQAAGQRIGIAGGDRIEATASGEGYWIFDRAGGVFTFGDAPFRGSVPGRAAE